MNTSAKRLARLAILTALAAVLLFLCSVLPTGRLGFMVIASFPIALALMQYGIGWSAAVYAITAVLSALLFMSDAVLGFILFFGYYPIVKSLFERIRFLVGEWAAKYAVYTAAFVLCALFASSLWEGLAWPVWVLWLAGAAVFFVYDRCYTAAISVYINKLARYLP